MALVGLNEPSGESGLFLIGEDEALFSQRLWERDRLDLRGSSRLSTVAEALETLIPEPVRQARAKGLKVVVL